CREQWGEIAAAAAAGQCASFGSRRDGTGAMADNGRVRPFTEALGTPDVYVASQGMGVVASACPPAPVTCAVGSLETACARRAARGPAKGRPRCSWPWPRRRSSSDAGGGARGGSALVDAIGAAVARLSGVAARRLGRGGGAAAGRGDGGAAVDRGARRARRAP